MSTSYDFTELPDELWTKFEPRLEAFWRKPSDILSMHNERYHLLFENRMSVEYHPKMLLKRKKAFTQFSAGA